MAAKGDKDTSKDSAKEFVGVTSSSGKSDEESVKWVWLGCQRSTVGDLRRRVASDVCWLMVLNSHEPELQLVPDGGETPKEFRLVSKEDLAKDHTTDVRGVISTLGWRQK